MNADSQNPNILLIMMDSVRAKNTSIHGHKNDTTPNLSAFARNATVYEQARSPGIWSLPSQTSIFTGEDVVDHGVTQHYKNYQGDSNIWKQLGSEGYRTGFFSRNWLLKNALSITNSFDHSTNGLGSIVFNDAVDPREFFHGEGNDTYRDYLLACFQNDNSIQSIINGVSHKYNNSIRGILSKSDSYTPPASTYGSQLLDWVLESDEPWAACVNFMDAHQPYISKPEHNLWGDKKLVNIQRDVENTGWECNGKQRQWWQWEALEALYDGCIHQIDEELGRLFDELKAHDEFDNTLIVITSDHGEAFGEYSRVRENIRLIEHQYGGHEVLLHVPLVVSFPWENNGRRVEELATLTRFPDVVNAVRQGDRENATFVPDKKVVAFNQEREIAFEQFGQQYVDDLTPYADDTYIIYEQQDDEIIKAIQWGKDSATVQVDSGYGINTLSPDQYSTDEIFDSIDSLTSDQQQDPKKIDSDTKNMLEELGYM